jgi:phage tail-like protein
MNFKARAWAVCLLTVAIAVVAVVVVNAQKGQRKDPLTTFRFAVEIDGQSIGFFKSIGGLKVETEVIEYQEGGTTDGIRKLAGPTRFANIRLTRTFTGDRFLYDWFRATKKPNPIRVTGRIIMFDRLGNEAVAWKFVNGFPVKWEGPELDASKNELAIESIEIAHEGLVLLPDDDDNNNQ